MKRINQDVPDPIANIAKSDQSSVPQANNFSSIASIIRDDQIEEISPVEDKRIAKLQEEEKEIRSE